MHAALATPLAASLSNKEEQDPEAAPQKDQAHVEHDRRDEPSADRPRGDELAEAVAPEVLVDGDGDEDRAGDGLVGVDGVGGGDGRDGGDLDARAGVADDDDDTPVPFVLIAKCHDEVSKQHDQDVGDQSRQSHFRFTDASILSGRSSGNPIR